MSNPSALPDPETVMAFADGELDAAQKALLEDAMKSDPLLRVQVEGLQQQRRRVEAAYAGMLDTPVPDRLTRLLQSPAVALAAAVVDLATARAERSRSRSLPSWAQLGGMAASIMLGVLLGARFMGTAFSPTMGLNDGQLVAGGAIDKALSEQLASDPVGGAGVAVQLSFVDKGGNYCRTFSTTAVAGLACQQTGNWVVQQVLPAEAQTTGGVRQAATPMPPALLAEVDSRMADAPLDAAGELQARARAWRK